MSDASPWTTAALASARTGRFGGFISRAQALTPIRIGVVHPCDGPSLEGALAARDVGLALLTLIGPRAKIEAAAKTLGAKLDGVEIVDAPHSHAAADQAVELVRQGHIEALMKGALHTDEFMTAVLRDGVGLRTDRRMSHVFVIDAPTYYKPLFITDAAINIAPSLDVKRDIVRNAIDLAHALGLVRPKVAILAAVETVEARMPATIDAAALCKMADRMQIEGADVDGPLAFDNAISLESARTKGIVSKVAGDADILVAPDLEAGNILAKQLVYLASAKSAGLALGARVPIVLTSRSDSAESRIVSCALAQLFARWRLPQN